MKKLCSLLLVILLVVSVLPGSAILTASALTDGDFTYEVSNNEVTITDFPETYSGSLIIPSTLGGLPVTKIGYHAFFACKDITSVTIPDTVTYIEETAFATYSDEKMSLEKVYITNLSAWCNIEFEKSNANPLSWGAELYLNNEPVINLSIPNDVTKISNYAFYKVKGIESITIPDSVEAIGEYAFYGCPDIKKVVIGDGVETLKKCFAGCLKLEEVVIGDGVKNILGAFAGCSKLKNVTFGNSVETLDEPSFNECTSIEKIHLPASLKSISEPISAFVSCTSLNTITVDESNQTYRAENNCLIERSTNKIILGCNTSVIPNSVKSIGHYAFALCPEMETLHIPASVTNIGYYQTMYNTKLASLTVDSNNPVYRAEGNCIINKATNEVVWGCVNSVIPDGVTSIGGTAFCNLDTIESVYIPASVTHIKQEAFGNNIIKNVYYGGTKEQKASINIDSYNKPLDSATWHYGVTCINGHKPVVFKGYAATCSKTGLTDGKKCSKCGIIITERKTIAKLTTHNYKTTTTKATLKKNGSVVKKCTVCSKVASNTKINYPKTIKLSTAEYTYNGKTKTATVTVKDSAGKKISSKNYTVEYASGRKNVGKYKVTITFKGNYTGKKTLYLTIKPRAASINKLTAGKKALVVKLNRSLKQSTGYEIQYSTSKKFTKSTTKTKKVSNYKTSSATLKSLKAKKTYYVRVRTYKTVGKTKYYSNWSSYKYKKTK